MRIGGLRFPWRAVDALLSILLAITLNNSLGASSTSAQTAPTRPEIRNLETVGQVGGPTRAVALRDGYAFVGQGRKLVVLDVSNPWQPRVVGATRPLGGKVEEITLDGGYAYLLIQADYEQANGGVRIVSIADPSNPVEVGSYQMSYQYARRLLVHGSYLFLANGERPSSTWTLLDVSDRTAPREVSSNVLSAEDLLIVGQYAYAVGLPDITVFDLADPPHPTPVGTVTWHPGPRKGQLASIRESAAAETYLYLISDVSALVVVDVADPTRPRVVAEATPNSSDVTHIDVSGNRAFISEALSRRFVVVDITDPTQPTVLSTVRTGTLAPEQIARVGDVAYIAASTGGLRVVNLEDLAYPVEIASYEGPASERPSVALAGDYAYVADAFNGLQVVRVSDPALPVPVGHYREDGEATRVVATGTYAYLLERRRDLDASGLRVLDVSDPTSPRRVGALNLTNLYGTDLVLAGAYAYVATVDRIVVVDVSNPTDPRQVGLYTLSFPDSFKHQRAFERVSSIAVDGQLIYMAFGAVTGRLVGDIRDSGMSPEGSGLSVVDVSDPTRPTEVSRTSVLWNPGSIAVVGHNVYVVGHLGGEQANVGLRIYDVSDPARPTPGPLLPGLTTNTTSNIALVGRYAYVAAGSLRVLDVTDPAQPTEVGASYAERIRSVATDGTLAYVGIESDGLTILRFNASTSGSMSSTIAPGA